MDYSQSKPALHAAGPCSICIQYKPPYFVVYESSVNKYGILTIISHTFCEACLKEKNEARQTVSVSRG